MSVSERARCTVLVADGCAAARSLLRECIAGHAFVVVGEAGTGHETIRKVHELDPHVVTLDLELPDPGGQAALRWILSEAPRPVVIVTAQTPAMLDPVVDAMLSGVVEFVSKPSDTSPGEIRSFRSRLARALGAAAHVRAVNSRAAARQPPPPARTAHSNGAVPARVAVALAASAGGPRAVVDVVSRLPADLPAAVFVVQHMPPLFTAALARRLNAAAAIRVVEAEDGSVPLEGVVYVAPGGRHMIVERAVDGVRIRLNDGAPLWGVRPAADLLFVAVASTFGPATIGVVLTGMGRDGADGLHAIREVGGTGIAQDESTAVIASMPRAAAKYAHRILPLDEIAGEIVARAGVVVSRERT
jgi:two-component system, chemotaxis family, protein-glutamate methylesterase/glutaminase